MSLEHAQSRPKGRIAYANEASRQRALSSVIAQTGHLLASSPVVWLYGLAIAALGWTNLPVSLVASGVRSVDNPVGRGGVGLIIVLLIAIVGLVAEVALVRTMTAPGNAWPALGSSVAQSGRIAGFLGASFLADAMAALCISAPLWWLMSTLSGAVASWYTLGFSVLLVPLLASVGLVLPFWIIVPLGLRAIAIGRRGVGEAVTDLSTLIFERARLIFFACVVWLAWLMLVFGLGTWLQARDVTLPSLLGVVSEWQGGNAAAGVAMLAVTGVGATVVAGLWTAVYRALAAPLGLDQPSTAGSTPAADETRREAAWLMPQVRMVMRALRLYPTLLLPAAIIAFFGAPGTADLLSYYNVVPQPRQTANQDVTAAIWNSLPVSGWGLLAMFALFFVTALVFSATLAVASSRPLTGQPVGMGSALRCGASRLLRVITAEIVWFVVVGFLAGIVWLAVLLGLALLVQVVPGLDPLVEEVQWPLALVALFAASGLVPFVARAVLLDNKPVSSAWQRALSGFAMRPAPLVAVFLFTFGLDVLRGPLAALAGLLTNGWTTLASLVFHRSLEQPIGAGALVGSVALYVVSTLVVAFKASLWTQLYLQTTPVQQPVEDAKPAPRPRRKRTASAAVATATPSPISPVDAATSLPTVQVETSNE